MKLQVVFVVAFIAVMSIVSSSMGSSQQVYCGRRLAIALALMCPDEDMAKRSYHGLAEGRNGLVEGHVYRTQNDYEEDNWPWIIKTHALEGIRGKRQGQGVAAECCDKPCSLNELLSYC